MVTGSVMRLPLTSTGNPAGVPSGLRWLRRGRELCHTASATATASGVIGRGVDAGSVALSMGHSFEVHCRSYPWASASGAAEAFERANAALVFGLNLPVKDATIPINNSTHSECVADIAMS